MACTQPELDALHGRPEEVCLVSAGSETPNYTSPAPKSLSGRASQRPSPADGQDASRPSSALKGSKVSPLLLAVPPHLLLGLLDRGSTTLARNTLCWCSSFQAAAVVDRRHAATWLCQRDAGWKCPREAL